MADKQKYLFDIIFTLQSNTAGNMLFNTPTFLFIFLPVCLVVYFLAGRQMRNWVALAASLIFFAWGQPSNLLLMLAVIAINFWLGQQIEQSGEQKHRARWFLTAGIGLNLAFLVLFKAAGAYGAEWRLPAFGADFSVQMQNIVLPLGFSYIAFQVIAYLLDVYHKVTPGEKSFMNFALYVMLFPKLITGPIVRYRDIHQQLVNREVTALGAANGARRFILGMAKKVLIADFLGRVVDPAFALESPAFSTGIAWLVLVWYALQLYFDFSGYTDMAIGLGQMLGFRFVENFNYPYISKSISEFWRRWHISLSTWFRDYVFYPLEFKRKRADRQRQRLNILIVFMLTGLWHGLTVNFLIWGLVHGLAIALESTEFGKRLKRTWAPVQHFYALAVVLFGWVFFRSATPAYAFEFLARLFGSQTGVHSVPFSASSPLPFVDNSTLAAMALGILFSLPVVPAVEKLVKQALERRAYPEVAAFLLYDLGLIFLLICSVAAASGFNQVATIYGGF